MSVVIPCSICATRAPGKLASVTWAWYLADGDRTAWRQKLCTACFAMNVAPLEVATREYGVNCPVCGIDSTEDLDAVFCTSYIPGLGKLGLELPTCSACAARVRVSAQVGAQKLENRPFGGQDPGPQTSNTPDAWAALGIEPR